MKHPAAWRVLQNRQGQRASTVGVALVIGAAACGDLATPVMGEPNEGVPCAPGATSPSFPDLRARPGAAATTTGTVPHQQINPDGGPEAIEEMTERIFALPDVESRLSFVIGATAIWLREGVNLGRPECAINERELGHIHEDGSLHMTLPHGRIPGAEAAGWVERHPWSTTRPGFEAYVMIFTPRDPSEVDVIVDLVALGIDFVKGS